MGLAGSKYDDCSRCCHLKNTDLKKLEALEKEIALLKAENEKLKQAYEKLKVACRYYALDASRSMSGDFRSYAVFKDDDVDEIFLSNCGPVKKGGKTARLALKEAEEILNK